MTLNLRPLVIASIFFLTLNLFLSSYFGFSQTSMFGADVKDGWCDPAHEGLGEHCFGDFYYPLRFSNLDNPWNQTLSPPPYPPLTMRVFGLFDLLHLSNTRLSLFIFLVLAFTSLSFPALFLYRRKLIDKQMLVDQLVLIFTCSSVIAALDRGNIIVIAFPFAFLYFNSILNQRFSESIIFLMFLFSIKPHLLVFSLVLLICGKLRHFFIAILSSFSLFAFSFILYPTRFPETLFSFSKVIINFQEFLDPGDITRGNLSIPNTLAFIKRYFIPLIFRGNEGSVHFPQLFSAILFIFSCIVLFFHFRIQRSPFNSLLFLSFAPILFPNVANVYYLIFPLALLLATVGNNLKFELLRQRQKILMYSAMILIFSPISLPWGLAFKFLNLFGLNVYDYLRISPWEIGISSHWILVSILLFISLIIMMLILSSQTIIMWKKRL